MVTERGWSASTRYASATGERILHPCATPSTSPLQTREEQWSRLPTDVSIAGTDSFLYCPRRLKNSACTARQSKVVTGRETDAEKPAKPQGNLAKGRTLRIVDTHRTGKRLIVHTDEKLTAFLEFESAIKIHLQN